MNRHIKSAISLILTVLMCLGTLSAAAAADSVKRVSCTVNGNTESSRGFCWYTESSSATDLRIVKEADFDESFSKAETFSGNESVYRSQYVHKVTVSGLESGTKYYYSAGDAAQNMWSATGSFTTDNGDSSFSFITIADVQASSDENFAHAALTMKAAMDACPAAEFAVNLGDFVNDNTNDEWDWYFKNFEFANLSLTGVPVAGNHDGNITNKLNTNCFKNMFNLDESANQSIEGVYYSFDYGNAHFSVLNTNDMYPMTQAQRNWLENDISASSADWNIVLMHRSAYSAGKNINKPDTVVMRSVLLPLFDKLGVDMVYAGHDHMYLRTTQVYADAAVENTQYVTEYYNGEELTFAVNPEGTVYALPSTAGTKRYSVNQDAMSPILDVADIALSTQELGGTFCTTQIDGGKLIYKAYTVNDETQAVTLIDTYAIEKDTGTNSSVNAGLDQSVVSSVLLFAVNFVKAIAAMFASYIKMLFN